MKIKRLLFNFLIIWLMLFFIPATSCSSESDPNWVGNIIMEYNLSNSLFKDLSDKNGIDRHDLNEKASFRVVIKACGTSAQNLRIQKPDASYTLTEHRFRQSSKKKCVRSSTGPGDKHMVDYKTPGDSKKDDDSFSGDVHPDFPNFISQDVLSVDKEKKEYAFSIALNQKPALLINGDLQGEEKYVCENNTFIKNVKFVSPAISKALGIDTPVSTVCDSSGMVCNSTAPAAERILPLIASFTGKYDGGKKIKGEVFYPDLKSIYGSTEQTIDDIMEKTFDSMKEMGKLSPELQKELIKAETEMRKSKAESKDNGIEGKKDPDLKSRETLKVSWEFEIKDQCDDIIDQLREDISMLRAYANEKIIADAARDGWDGSHPGDGKVYDERVAMEGVKQFKSHWWDPNYKPPPNSGASHPNDGSAKIDLATNNDCKVVNVDEVKDDYKKKCYPDVLFKSMYEHELTHARQCKNKTTSAEYKSGTPRSYQKLEMEAYCVGAGIILNYAKEHCKDHDLKPYEKEIKRLCGGK
ncbi:MAG: hypothetical protein JW925_11810 [Syntrophaceae bacterium]|nr:hypothetical protein [Syntrophaceae bacterium]